MGKVENYTAFAEAVARDNTHGYDQIDRWGNPNYDCSGLVIRAVDNQQIPVRNAGASYTGNMYNAFIKCGFKDVTASVNKATGSGMKRGDILLNVVHHTAIFCGNGQMVDARSNEWGGATGGKSGDQTGHEIEIHSYRNYPWDYVLRFEESTVAPAPTQSTLLQYGSRGSAVSTLQANLNKVIKAGLVVDGDFGIKTWNAVVSFQKNNGLVVDGVYGPKSDAKMQALLKSTPAPTASTYVVTAKAGLRIRTGANGSSSIVTAMPYGSEFKVTKTSNGWAYGTWKSYSGWASMEYLRKK